MSEAEILTHVENKVATLTLNRPGKLNALSRDLIGQAIELLIRARYCKSRFQPKFKLLPLDE